MAFANVVTSHPHHHLHRAYSLPSTPPSAFFIPHLSLRIRKSISAPPTMPPLRATSTPAPVPVLPADARTVEVDLGDRSYPIYIGYDLLADPSLLRRHLNKSCLIVTNDTIAPLYLDQLVQGLTAHDPTLRVETVVLRDGEEYKTLDELNKIYDKAISARLDRRTTFVALGGGVIGDMTGYAAASFLRGVDFVQVRPPTPPPQRVFQLPPPPPPPPPLNRVGKGTFVPA